MEFAWSEAFFDNVIAADFRFYLRCKHSRYIGLSRDQNWVLAETLIV